MNLNDELLTLCKEVYPKVVELIEANRSAEDYRYSRAIFTLDDGREYGVSFANNPISGMINMKWDNKTERDTGYYFYIIPEGQNGFEVKVHLYFADREHIYFNAGEKECYNPSELTEEEKILVLNFVKNVCNQIPTMKFNSEKTYSIENYTIEEKQKYESERFALAVQELKESGADRLVLPFVDDAVSWWIDKITAPHIVGSIGYDLVSTLKEAHASEEFEKTTITKEQVEIFREELTKSIMEGLSRGFFVTISSSIGCDMGFHDAMEKAGISPSKAPLKSIMSITLDTVRAQAGYLAETEIVYSSNEKGKGKK